ncbi:LOW QUALITY PROTEIN: receptor-like protein kinase FERONIA [Prunus avium]|uniref:LOW QUALITY PROTEIN: receptor-like protein kinase FERONIA n=1 Tax=Prunus avium TaxID=42229 RepID=A0A6P5RGA6_PRUAV|nr:LOW QUALITY PROTEIN: receptor-like protein kinase FERONIA [Prunus avium]
MKNPSSKHLHKSITMKPFLTPLFLPLFLHIITLHVAGDTSPIYTPVDDITLQCGFSGDKLNPDDTRTWTGDINSKFSPFENQAAGSPSISRQAPSSSSESQVPYRTVRLSRSEFTYRFPVTTGPKFIRLYFNPASYGPDFDRSEALFSVKAGGFTLLKDFNSSVTADASGSATIYREFCLNVESEQSLNITFNPSRATSDAYAFINGIEIVSVPNNLYYTSAQNSDGVNYIGSENTFPIENGTALEMVYRFNVGGRSLFFNQDTGMYRNWYGEQDENKYLDNLSLKFSVLPQNSSIELNFTEIAKYSGPEELYRTGRSMGINKTINKSYNLTWEFPVDPKFLYLLRLHFCEFGPDITKPRDRQFQIFIANQTAFGIFLGFRRGGKVKDSSSSHGTKWGPFSFSTNKSTKTRSSSLPSDLCRYFSLAEIKAATQNFNSVFIIGVGGFGHVYKGNINFDGGATSVAIKRLKPESSQGALEFKTEIEMLSQLRHNHLVPLIGYCTDEGEMILVYDYMARGTLRDHLYHTDNPPLAWDQRLQICIGAARGLHYLHTGAKYTIIHRDVKSTNILLDEKWVAKVSDFGLSKMGSTTVSKTHISTVVKGSFGYLDPEYYRRQQLTEKSDVYSFGVVLCEVLCARPALIRTVEKKQMSLAEWTKICHRNGKIDQIIDPSLRGKIGNACLNKYVEIAVSCLQDNGIERPSMNDVVWGLEFALQLQQSGGRVLNLSEEKKGEDEESLMNAASDAGFSCSWEDSSSELKVSRVTNSSSDHNSSTNESMKGMSGTVFSEINDPNGRLSLCIYIYTCIMNMYIITQASNKHLDTITMIQPILSTHLYFSLFLHMIVVTIFVAGDSPPIYKPVEDITVNCGSSDNTFNEYDNRSWSGDINPKFSPLEPQAVGNTSICKEAPHSYTVQRVPYATARLSYSEFTYRFFHLTPGQKFVRLYFYPASYPDFDSSKALFSVKAAGFTLLHDFNASVTAAASRLEEETVYREFCMNIGEEEEEQSISITFTPSSAIADAYAFINGIEIVSMPTNLYYTTDGIQFVGSENNDFRIENSTVLETVYRINVGGSEVSFVKDTGMYRYWYSYTYEERYLEVLSSKYSVLPQNVSIQLRFTTKPQYSAPKEVYQTARAMGKNTTINKSYNLTWQFPVDSNFRYLVRLHFCEFQPEVMVVGYQVFLIYMDNLEAEKRADIIMWAGGNGIPTYRDYLVFIQPTGSAGSKKRVNLVIALQGKPNGFGTKISDAMLNGLEIFKLNNSDGNLAGPNPDPPPMDPENTTPSAGPEKPKSRSTPLLAIVAGVVSTTIALLSVLGLFLGFRRRQKLNDNDLSTRKATNSTKSRRSSLPSDLCHYFSLSEIKAATRNFSDICIIGRGGFGNVYKGYLDDGATPVAIKRLKPESSQGAHEFQTEIQMLSQLRHQHLVSLVGYCTDDGEMILVYDYMARGTLCDHLYHTDNPSLSWDQRVQICIGAARGLHYLHTGAHYTIIHRDVKSTNILLDEKWVTKVSDFGLSKMGTITMSKTHISTMVKGSFGYLDPEYYRRNQLTEKSDVYSFGVVLCEVLCARPALLRTVEKKQMSLAEWVKSCHRKGTLDQIIDPSLKGKIGNACLNKFVEMAISCMHDNGIERPSMNDVVWGLEYAMQLHQREEREKDLDLENKGEDEVALMNDNHSTGFTTSRSWEGETLNSGLTKTSSEQNSTTNDSIKGMSRIVFSGIDDSDGR